MSTITLKNIVAGSADVWRGGQFLGTVERSTITVQVRHDMHNGNFWPATASTILEPVERTVWTAYQGVAGFLGQAPTRREAIALLVGEPRE